MTTIEVYNAFRKENGLATPVWISEQAAEVFAEYSEREQPPGKFRKKLLRFAKNGFKLYMGNGIEHEWDGVYRIGDGGLFRLIGFFAPDGGAFVVVDAYTKRGTELTASQRARINAAAAVRKSGSWKTKP